MIELNIGLDGVPNSKRLQIGNKYENNDEVIKFILPIEFENYKKYVIAVIKKNNEKVTKVFPITDNQFFVSTDITYISGSWSMYLMCRENEIDLEAEEVDISANNGEHVFISDGFIGVVSDSDIDKELVDNIPMDTNLHIVYEDLLKIKQELIDKINTPTSYNDLVDVPTKVSQFENDKKYQTEEEVTALELKITEEINARESAITELKEDLVNKLPKSPADWETWTEDEQSVARTRIGISEYELLCDVTLEEAIDDFVRDTYSDGTPYNLSKALVFINVPVQESGYVPGTCWIYFKDSNKFNSGRLYYSSKSSVNRQFIFKAEQITSNGVWSLPTGECGQEYLVSTGMNVYNTKIAISNICAVQITCSLPKGTNIQIYGVRE